MNLANIEIININLIKNNECNPRKLTEEQETNLTESIKRFGLVDPLILNSNETRKNILIGGHQRLKVIKKLGHKEVPVIFINLTEEKEKELNLRLNQNNGEWDYDLLKKFDLELLLDVGFNDTDLSQIWDNEIEIEDYVALYPIDEFKEAKETTIKKGDIYKLGKSFLICGDSLNKKVYEKLLKDKLVDMIYWDPPFNINIDYDKGLGRKSNYGGDVKDKKTDEEYKTFLKSILQNALSFSNKDVHVFTYCDQKYLWLLQELYKELNIINKRVCLWIKNGMGLTPKIAFNKCYEPCVYGIKGNPYLSNIKNFNEILNKDVDSGNRTIEDIIDLFDIWLAKRDVTNQYEHPTQKPLSLHEKSLKRCTKIGDIVLDMCAGSGSTLLSCEQLNRICYSIEISPIFCQLIISRFERIYGKKSIKLN